MALRRYRRVTAGQYHRVTWGREELDVPPYRTLGLLTSDDARRVAPDSLYILELERRSP